MIWINHKFSLQLFSSAIIGVTCTWQTFVLCFCLLLIICVFNFSSWFWSPWWYMRHIFILSRKRSSLSDCSSDLAYWATIKRDSKCKQLCIWLSGNIVCYLPHLHFYGSNVNSAFSNAAASLVHFYIGRHIHTTNSIVYQYQRKFINILAFELYEDGGSWSLKLTSQERSKE